MRRTLVVALAATTFACGDVAEPTTALEAAPQVPEKRPSLRPPPLVPIVPQPAEAANPTPHNGSAHTAAVLAAPPEEEKAARGPAPPADPFAKSGNQGERDFGPPADPFDGDDSVPKGGMKPGDPFTPKTQTPHVPKPKDPFGGDPKPTPKGSPDPKDPFD